MNDAHDAFEELAAGYVLDALDAADSARFEQHLVEGCPACGRTLREHREALARLAAENAVTPPVRARDALLTRVGRASTRGPARVRLLAGWVASAALAASIAALVTANLVGTRYETRLELVAREAATLREQLAAQARTVSDLRQQLDAQAQVLTMVRTEGAEQARTLALLNDPATRIVSLVGLKPSPGAQARMFWNPGAGGLLLATDLPPAPAGKVYELWAIAGGKPLPAGLFTVDAAGRGSVKVAPIEGVARVDVFAVTLEPAGGVASPTGEMYLASKPA